MAEKVVIIRREVNNQPPRFLYQPPELSDTLKYIYSARHEIEKKIRSLVLSTGGGWAGCSMAGFDNYLEKARVVNVISQDLHDEITDFIFMYMQPMINYEDVLEEQLQEVQYLVAHINRQLDAIPLGPLAF